MESVGKHHSSYVQRSLPQITQITRILGAGKKDTNHTDVAQEKSVTIRGICGKTFLKLRAEEPPTDYADLHGYWVQGEGHESHGCSTRNICDNSWNLWENILSSSMRRSPHRLHRFTRILGTEKKDTNHTDVAQEKSVTIRGICGKHSLKQNP